MMGGGGGGGAHQYPYSISVSLFDKCIPKQNSSGFCVEHRVFLGLCLDPSGTKKIIFTSLGEIKSRFPRILYARLLLGVSLGWIPPGVYYY